MKTNLFRKYVLTGAAMGLGMALPCVAGPAIIITPPAPPTVVISAPMPPAVVVAPAPVAVVPDNYYYDGTEYVGIVGGQYYYLGPGNVWAVMDPARLHRFQGWQHDHADWRTHSVHNVNYRGNAQAHAQPMHGDQMHGQPGSDHPDHDHNGPPQ